MLEIAAWLRENIAPIKTPTVGSYSMKHVVEGATGDYMTNGELIAAALVAGYPVRFVPGPNRRVGGTHCCAPPPSEPCVHLVDAHGSSKPLGALQEYRVCWFPVGAGCPALAVGVNESGVVRRAACPMGDDVLSGDRLAGGAVPLFPFTGALWLTVGVQEQVPACRATSFLLA